jgi:arsenate reductase (thioredoxin)
MFDNLSNTIKSIAEIPVSEERKEILNALVDYIQNKVNTKRTSALKFHLYT